MCLPGAQTANLLPSLLLLNSLKALLQFFTGRPRWTHKSAVPYMTSASFPKSDIPSVVLLNEDAEAGKVAWCETFVPHDVLPSTSGCKPEQKGSRSGGKEQHSAGDYKYYWAMISPGMLFFFNQQQNVFLYPNSLQKQTNKNKTFSFYFVINVCVFCLFVCFKEVGIKSKFAFVVFWGAIVSQLPLGARDQCERKSEANSYANQKHSYVLFVFLYTTKLGEVWVW